MARWWVVVILWLLASAAAAAGAAGAEASAAQARQVWQLLDYLAVDYGGAVAHGAVANEAEYTEMREFAANAAQQADRLPPHPGKPGIVATIAQLQQAVQQLAGADEVARLAGQANTLLLAAYPIPLAPKSPPDLRAGAALYQAQCASCHGAGGRGDGPLATTLQPRPIAFTDAERARSRSLLALYQVVSQGVAGTSMPGFAELSEAERWALAFHVGTLSHDDAMRRRGAALWKHDAAAHAQWPDLAALTTSSEAAAAQSLPADVARDLTAFLRANPKALDAGTGERLSLARERLAQSLAAARAGDPAGATRLALSAYLDGFEPLEPALGARDKALLAQVESAMLGYRAAIAGGGLDDAARQAQRLDQLFVQVEQALEAGSADATTAFAGAFTILLREGLEALLIVVGMVAVLRKAGRPEVLRHVHAGWASALAAGALTWAAATYVVGISGASREVTEGLSSVFAALVLLSVGLWMHQKSAAGRWQAYLKGKLSSALSSRSAWGLFALAFIAVYREVFETVLFFSALAVDGHGAALLGGLGSAAAVLALVAWLLLRTSARMPIGKFFSWSSVLIAVLAVVLVGKGVASLQEAGWVSAQPIEGLRLQLLGVYPSLEPLLAQLAVAVLALVGFGLNRVMARRAPAVMAG